MRMNVAIRYYTKKGNTKKLADAISSVVGVDAYSIQTPIKEKCDILFLCNSIYKFGIDPEVKSFIENLDSSKIGKVVNISTSASGNSTHNQVKEMLDLKGIVLHEPSFSCKGSFLFVNKNRPNAQDIQECQRFIENIIDESL